MQDESSNKAAQFTQHRMLLEWGILGAAAIFIVIIFAMLAQQLPIGVDYHFTFRPAARDWLAGKTHLYDDNGHGFFNAPWTLILLVPISQLSFVAGQAILNSLSLFGIMWSIHLWRQARPVPSYVVIAALLNIHTLDLLVRAQLDVLVLLGLVVGWWAIQHRKPWILSFAFCLLGIKPLNVGLVGVLFLIAIRNWPLRDIVKSVGLPIVMAVGSAFFIGFDWPLRYIEFARNNSLYNQGTKITIWKAADLYGLPYLPFMMLGLIAVGLFLKSAWRVNATMWMVGVAVGTNLVFTTHANGNHYVLLIPALLYLATQNKWLFGLAYLTTFTPLSRLVLGTDYSWLDIFYPLVLLIATWYFGVKTDTIAEETSETPDSTAAMVVAH